VAEPPAAAVVDVNLPGIDGFEVARRLRAIAVDVGVVMMSALDMRARTTQILALGIRACLHKPFDLASFHAAVLAAVAARR
jgi:DNA-binding response OmpR family regulator